jgi:hypothetical protein
VATVGRRDSGQTNPRPLGGRERDVDGGAVEHDRELGDDAGTALRLTCNADGEPGSAGSGHLALSLARHLVSGHRQILAIRVASSPACSKTGRTRFRKPGVLGGPRLESLRCAQATVVCQAPRLGWAGGVFFEAKERRRDDDNP